MIRIMLGKMGSGKTACVVREMINNTDDKTIFSNIIIKNKHKNIHQIKRDMIIKETELLKVNKYGKEIYKKQLNVDFWKDAREKYKSLNVVLDEAHNLLNSRRAFSSVSMVMNDWVALLRRVVGDSDGTIGSLTLITQLGRKLDVNIRELATEIHYHKCHYIKTCKKCNLRIHETNEDLVKYLICPRCHYNKFVKSNFIIEKWEFENTEHCTEWIENKIKIYHKHYFITDIEKYFPYYDTYQWDDLISEY